MRILVLNWKFLEIISRFCATLSAIGCTNRYLAIRRHLQKLWPLYIWVGVHIYVCGYGCLFLMYTHTHTNRYRAIRCHLQKLWPIYICVFVHIVCMRVWMFSFNIHVHTYKKIPCNPSPPAKAVAYLYLCVCAYCMYACMSVFFYKDRHTHIQIDTLPSVATCKSCCKCIFVCVGVHIICMCVWMFFSNIDTHTYI